MSNQPLYRDTNVRDFPHSPMRENLEDSSSSSSGGSSSTTTDSVVSSSSTTTVQLRQIMEENRKKEALQRVAAEGIREHYKTCIGNQMPPSLFRRILLDLIDGTPSQYYSYALDETCLAPNPSPRYMLAIVNRLKREKADPETVYPVF